MTTNELLRIEVRPTGAALGAEITGVGDPVQYMSGYGLRTVSKASFLPVWFIKGKTATVWGW